MIDNYELGEKISGKNDTKCFYAIKGKKQYFLKAIEIRKEDLIKRGRIENEVEILKSLNHKNIIKFVDSMEIDSGEEEIHCIVTKLEKMNLAQYVQRYKDQKVQEKKCKKIMKQVFSAVEYLHQQRIVHQDLKLENVMINKSSLKTKLIDFGMSTKAKDEEEIKNMRIASGSPYYISPEKFSNKIYDGRKSDAWSLGVLLFKLASGYFPFNPRHNNIHELSKLIREGGFRMPYHFSKELASLITMLLQKDPIKRISVSEALHHPWFKRKGTIKIQKPEYLRSLSAHSIMFKIKSHLSSNPK